jgi:hypothetical protein
MSRPPFENGFRLNWTLTRTPDPDGSSLGANRALLPPRSEWSREREGHQMAKSRGPYGPKKLRFKAPPGKTRMAGLPVYDATEHVDLWVDGQLDVLGSSPNHPCDCAGARCARRTGYPDAVFFKYRAYILQRTRLEKYWVRFVNHWPFAGQPSITERLGKFDQNEGWIAGPIRLNPPTAGHFLGLRRPKRKQPKTPQKSKERRIRVSWRNYPLIWVEYLRRHQPKTGKL